MASNTQLARKGWLGIANETTQGVPVTPADYLPFTSNTLHGMQQPIADQTARGIRDKNYGSVLGKRWSEGDVEFHLDASLSGYFLGSAFGTNVQSTLTTGVYSHALSRNNLNQPQEAMTLTNDRVVDREYYRGMVTDTLEIKAADQFIEAKSSLKGFFPITSVSGTGTTTSGTLLTWANYNTYFGTVASGISNANVNVRMSDFDFTIHNNTEETWRSGTYDPVTIEFKEFEVDGNWTIFFENKSDRDTYYNVTKDMLVFDAIGAGIGGGYNERLTINFYQIRIDAFTLETGLDNFFAEKVKFIAEYNSSTSKTIDGTLINTNSNY